MKNLMTKIMTWTLVAATASMTVQTIAAYREDYTNRGEGITKSHTGYYYHKPESYDQRHEEYSEKPRYNEEQRRYKNTKAQRPQDRRTSEMNEYRR